MVAAKKIEASTTPRIDFFLCFERRYQSHNPDTGRNESSETLVSAATPQSTPNPIHGAVPSRSSILSVSQKISASSSAARLVSHTHRVDQYITDGSSAHVHAVHNVTFSLKLFFSIMKYGIHVNDEERIVMQRKIIT